MSKEPLYPHVPKRKEPLFPHRPGSTAEAAKEPFIKVGERVRFIGSSRSRYGSWPEGKWLEYGVTGTVTEYHPESPEVRVKGEIFEALPPYAVVTWDLGAAAKTVINPEDEGERWEREAKQASRLKEKRFVKVGERVRHIGSPLIVEHGIAGTVITYHPASTRGPMLPYATVRWDNGRRTTIDANTEGKDWERIQPVVDNVEVYTSEVLPEQVAQGRGLHRDPKVEFRYTASYLGPDLDLFRRDLQKLLREEIGIPYLAVDTYYIRP